MVLIYQEVTVIFLPNNHLLIHLSRPALPIKPVLLITEHNQCGRANLVEADLWSQLPVGGSGLLELLPQAVAFVAHDLAISPAWLSDNMGPVSAIDWAGANWQTVALMGQIGSHCSRSKLYPDTQASLWPRGRVSQRSGRRPSI
jgi:hypothetical protein